MVVKMKIISFLNSLKYAKHVHLPIKIAVKSVPRVTEEELFCYLTTLVVLERIFVARQSKAVCCNC